MELDKTMGYDVLRKQHKHVLATIARLIESVKPEFAKPNFRLCSEISDLQNGKPQPFYSITRDGFASAGARTREG